MKTQRIKVKSIDIYEDYAIDITVHFEDSDLDVTVEATTHISNEWLVDPHHEIITRLYELYDELHDTVGVFPVPCNWFVTFVGGEIINKACERFTYGGPVAVAIDTLNWELNCIRRLNSADLRS